MSGSEPVWRVGLVIALWIGRSVPAIAADGDPPVQRPRAMLEPPADSSTLTPAASEVPTETASQQVEPPQPSASAPVVPSVANDTTAVPANRTTTAEPARQPVSAPAPAPRAAASVPVEPTLHATAKRSPKQYRHNGFVVDGRLGTLGCVRALCGSDRHDVRPGVRLDGFLGGNIRGWVDLGVSGGWGTMTPRVDEGTNVLSLYGLDPFRLQQALDLLGGRALGIDLGSLAVTDAKLRAAQFGPLVRVHFIPRGRFTAYVGTGAQYNLFRAKYNTLGGDVRLDFHGLAVPIQAGFGVHVLENLAVGVQFDYLWSWYGLATVDHPSRTFTLPVRVLESAAQMQQVDIRRQLPQFWTFGFALRARV